MNMKNNLITFLCCAALLAACENPEKEKENTTVEKVDVTKTATDKMVNSVNNTWNAIIKQDDDKFASIKRLLDEISYTKKYDMAAQDALVKEIPVVKSLRFNQDNIDSSAVEKYDEATDEYVKKVMTLADKTKELESHPIAAELKDDIMNANSVETIVQVRNNYNKAVQAYNDYLQKNKEEIAKMGPPYNELSPKKTF
jgi:hypothetical protein